MIVHAHEHVKCDVCGEVRRGVILRKGLLCKIQICTSCIGKALHMMRRE